MTSMEQIIQDIRLVVFDFDGVFTDNRVYVFEDGREAVVCNRGDGIGLAALKQLGIRLLVLSKESNPVVSARCRKLDIPCEQGCDDKKQFLGEYLRRLNIDSRQLCYMGNDINDLECLAMAALPVCVADAYPQVKQLCSYQTAREGGQGAVREFCDWFVSRHRIIRREALA